MPRHNDDIRGPRADGAGAFCDARANWHMHDFMMRQIFRRLVFSFDFMLMRADAAAAFKRALLPGAAFSRRCDFLSVIR